MYGERLLHTSCMHRERLSPDGAVCMDSDCPEARAVCVWRERLTYRNCME